MLPALRSRSPFIGLFIVSTLFLAACEPSANTTNTNEADYANPDDTINADEAYFADNQSDAVCGSVKPLLSALPAATNIGPYTEYYRGCEISTGVGVGVEYEYIVDEETVSTYSFSVTVLDGSSPYAASQVDLPNATAEQKAYFINAMTGTGKMIVSQWEVCLDYAKNPVLFNGRNPETVKVDNVDMCITDRMDSSNEVWRAIAVYNNLAFEVEMTGAEAAKLTTSVQAKEHLLPIFRLFQIP